METSTTFMLVSPGLAVRATFTKRGGESEPVYAGGGNEAILLAGVGSEDLAELPEGVLVREVNPDLADQILNLIQQGFDFQAAMVDRMGKNS